MKKTIFKICLRGFLKNQRMRLKNLQVLIKTDDKDLGEIMKEIVLKIGANIVEIETPSKEDFKKIDVLILDAREMKDEFMYKFINEIKEVNQALKVMILTYKNSIKSSILAMKAGIAEEVFFPIEINQLKNKIKSVLEMAKKEKNL
uniref:Response regulator n=1 Tax=Thermodesulfobacterium geofontis TaxID=1295609 RepID=A0A7V5XHC3_9BACT